MISLVWVLFSSFIKRFLFYFILHAINHGIPYPYFPLMTSIHFFFFVIPIILPYKVDYPRCSGSLLIGLQSLKPFPSCPISSFFRVRQVGAKGTGAPHHHHHQGRERGISGFSFFSFLFHFPFFSFRVFSFFLRMGWE